MLIVLIRSFILYGLIVFAIRLMGKRQLGELQPSELVVTILVSNIASMPMEDINIPLFMGIIPILIVVSMDVIMSNITLKSKAIRRIVSGSPKIIIRDGVVNQQELRRLRYSIDDLMESLREKDIFDINDVQYAIVETTGKINAFLKFPAQTTTAEMLSLEGQSSNPPSVIVSDGVVVNEGLEACMLPREWVQYVLDKHNIRLSDVFLLTSDDKGEYLLIPKNKIRNKIRKGR